MITYFYREVRKIYHAKIVPRPDDLITPLSFHPLRQTIVHSLDLSHFRPSVYLKILFLEARFLIIETRNNCKRESQSIDIVIRFSESIWNWKSSTNSQIS